VVTKLEGDNQGGEKIQGILEERGLEKQVVLERKKCVLSGMASLAL